MSDTNFIECFSISYKNSISSALTKWFVPFVFSNAKFIQLKAHVTGLCR